MFEFSKQTTNQENTVSELLKLDSKKVELQLKDDEMEIGMATRKATNDLKQSGKQKQCYLGIRSFFPRIITYIQKSLELSNPLIDALVHLHLD